MKFGVKTFFFLLNIFIWIQSWQKSCGIVKTFITNMHKFLNQYQRTQICFSCIWSFSPIEKHNFKYKIKNNRTRYTGAFVIGIIYLVHAQKYSKKSTFLIPWYTHARVHILGVRNVSFQKNFVYALNGWSGIPPIGHHLLLLLYLWSEYWFDDQQHQSSFQWWHLEKLFKNNKLLVIWFPLQSRY